MRARILKDAELREQLEKLEPSTDDRLTYWGTMFSVMVCLHNHKLADGVLANAFAELSAS